MSQVSNSAITYAVFVAAPLLWPDLGPHAGPVTSTTWLAHLDAAPAKVSTHGEDLMVVFGGATASTRIVGSGAVARRLITDCLA